MENSRPLTSTVTNSRGMYGQSASSNLVDTSLGPTYHGLLDPIRDISPITMTLLCLWLCIGLTMRKIRDNHPALAHNSRRLPFRKAARASGS